MSDQKRGTGKGKFGPMVELEKSKKNKGGGEDLHVVASGGGRKNE